MNQDLHRARAISSKVLLMRRFSSILSSQGAEDVGNGIPLGRPEKLKGFKIAPGRIAEYGPTAFNRRPVCFQVPKCELQESRVAFVPWPDAGEPTAYDAFFWCDVHAPDWFLCGS